MWQQMLVYDAVQCAVPEKIHTHPVECHRKFLGGGDLKSQNFQSKVCSETGISGLEGAKQKTCRGSMDIFWNCAIEYIQVFCIKTKSFHIADLSIILHI